jgi:excisionase family DNA binding protein
MSLVGKQYTTGELAVLFLVSPRTVRKWIERHGLAAARVGKAAHRRVAHEDLLGWLGEVWPDWRTGMKEQYLGPQGKPSDWWRGVIQRRVGQWPWLRDWLALLDCEGELAERGDAPDRPSE